MVNIKTGVSLRKELAEEADALAQELRVTRSELYSMALRDFIRRRENARLLERLDAAYGDGLDAEEERLLKEAKETARRLVAENGR